MTEAATPITTAPDYAPMFANLKESFESEKTMSLQWRSKQLEALERMMVECEQDFLDALASDLGKHTRPASRVAVSLAQQYGATIVMCHALEPVGAYGRALIETYVSSEDLEAVYQEGQQCVLENMRERLKKFTEEELAGTADMSAHVSSLVVKEGLPGEVIVEEAQSHGVDPVQPR